MPLTPEDLAYMRETQADHRPTEATLRRPTAARDALGGTSPSPAQDLGPIGVRISGPDDTVPAALDGLERANLVRVTTDLVTVRKGDRLEVSAAEVYEVVSEGGADPASTWTTAQQVWAVRVRWPE